METRHHIEGPFENEFPAICNHCGVMTAWSCKTWKFCEQFLRFGGKTTPCGNIFKILFRKFTWRHRLTLLCSNVVKFVRRDIGEIVPYLRDQNKFRLHLKLSLLCGSRYCVDRAKNLPGPAPNIWLILFQISSKSVHFRLCYSRTREDRFCPIEYLHDRLLEPIMKGNE